LERIKRIEKIGLVLTVLAGIVSAFLTPSMTAGLLLGGALMVANLYILGKIVERALMPEATVSAVLVAAFFLKFAALFGLVAVLFIFFKVSPIAFAIGTSTLIVAILYDALTPARET